MSVFGKKQVALAGRERMGSIPKSRHVAMTSVIPPSKSPINRSVKLLWHDLGGEWKKIMARTETSERRPLRRRRVFLSAILVSSDGSKTADCAVIDLSPDGARITLHNTPVTSGWFYFINMRDRTAHLATVAWRAPRVLGLKFAQRYDLASGLDPKLAFIKDLWFARARQ